MGSGESALSTQGGAEGEAVPAGGSESDGEGGDAAEEEEELLWDQRPTGPHLGGGHGNPAGRGQAEVGGTSQVFHIHQGTQNAACDQINLRKP